MENMRRPGPFRLRLSKPREHFAHIHLERQVLDSLAGVGTGEWSHQVRAARARNRVARSKVDVRVLPFGLQRMALAGMGFGAV